MVKLISHNDLDMKPTRTQNVVKAAVAKSCYFLFCIPNWDWPPNWSGYLSSYRLIHYWGKSECTFCKKILQNLQFTLTIDNKPVNKGHKIILIIILMFKNHQMTDFAYIIANHLRRNFFKNCQHVSNKLLNNNVISQPVD